MQSRQNQLLIGLGAVVLLWLGSRWVDSWLLAPLRQLKTDVAAKQDSVDAKELQVLAIEQAKGKLRAWQARSLTPDPGKKARPTATEALRQYSERLSEVAHSIALDEVTVEPLRQSASRNGVYVEVVAQIDGEGRYSQFLQLLERFYRADVMQRIGRLQVTSLDVVGDPPVRFTLEAAALAMAESGPPTNPSQRKPKFPRTTLTENIDEAATSLTVAAAGDFPQKTPFRIGIERELLEVTAAAGARWTVRRGVERTEPAEHPQRSTVSLVRLDDKVKEITRAEFLALVRDNIFVKQTLPIRYEFQFGPFAPPPVVRGQPWDFSIAAKDFDPARGDPSYQFLGDVPPGLAVNAATGQLSWKLASSVKAGDYPVEVEIRHPSAANGRESQKLTLTVAEPNTAPQFAKVERQKAYRGQPFVLNVAATDADQPAQKLTYKLGSGAPKEAKVDAKTGEVRWTPAEDYTLGPAKLAVVATDSGTPPQSTTLNLNIEVAEDSARTTVLTGIVGVGDEREAWFSDKSQERTTMVRVGENLEAADVTAKVVAIDAETVTVEISDKSRTMKLGDSVRSLTETAPATNPRGSARTQR